MFRNQKKNQKGFTLVEVIVVAVIVAVLALVAIQLYQGYVREARQNTAENLAASAASFLQSAENMESGYALTSLTLNPGDRWNSTMPTTKQTISFECPANSQIVATDDPTGATVEAIVGTGTNIANATRFWR